VAGLIDALVLIFYFTSSGSAAGGISLFFASMLALRLSLLSLLFFSHLIL
jgi:hypothetical protein